MKNNAEANVSQFYNTIGWKIEGGTTEDAKRWEDLRECAKEYVSKCRLRVLKYIPKKGEYILDMGAGPIQYEEYLKYSKNFSKRYCIDLSSKALDEAKKKIGNHGIFSCGSFFEINLEKNHFDCAISLHTIYHINKNKQEEAVRKLIRVTKFGKPVIIVYSNPKTLFRYITLPLRVINKIIKKSIKEKKESIYFYAHSINWWDRFSDVSNVKIVPWRSFDSNTQKRLIPNNKLGKKLFDILYYLEEHFPGFFANYFQYPMIILTKKKLEGLDINVSGCRPTRNVPESQSYLY